MRSNYSKIGAGVAIGNAIGIALNNVGFGVGLAIVFSAAFIQKKKTPKN